MVATVWLRLVAWHFSHLLRMVVVLEPAAQQGSRRSAELCCEHVHFSLGGAHAVSHGCPSDVDGGGAGRALVTCARQRRCRPADPDRPQGLEWLRVRKVLKGIAAPALMHRVSQKPTAKTRCGLGSRNIPKSVWVAKVDQISVSCPFPTRNIPKLVFHTEHPTWRKVRLGSTSRAITVANCKFALHCQSWEVGGTKPSVSSSIPRVLALFAFCGFPSFSLGGGAKLEQTV